MKELLENEFLIQLEYSSISCQEPMMCQIDEKMENIEVKIKVVTKLNNVAVVHDQETLDEETDLWLFSI